MNLTYRGISYEYPPATVETQGELVGKYRGIHWRFSTPTLHSGEEPTSQLMYRGVSYTHTPVKSFVPAVVVETPTVALAEPEPTPVVLSLEDKARALTISHCRSIKKRQQSMLGRLAAEVGLSADVSEYWNRIQGKVHPTFRTCYERSAVAFS